MEPFINLDSYTQAIQQLNPYSQNWHGIATPNAVPYYPSPGQLPQLGAQTMPDGTKPIVICGGVVTEVKDLDEAQRMAEEQAHQKSANAYILKPVKRIAPKRETVTTDLP